MFKTNWDFHKEKLKVIAEGKFHQRQVPTLGKHKFCNIYIHKIYSEVSDFLWEF